MVNSHPPCPRAKWSKCRIAICNGVTSTQGMHGLRHQKNRDTQVIITNPHHQLHFLPLQEKVYAYHPIIPPKECDSAFTNSHNSGWIWIKSFQLNSTGHKIWYHPMTIIFLHIWPKSSCLYICWHATASGKHLFQITVSVVGCKKYSEIKYILSRIVVHYRTYYPTYFRRKCT